MGSLSVAAFWAGAAHPRRQKHREIPPPGASAPAFAATFEPALMQEVHREMRAWARDEAHAEGGMCWECLLGMGYFLQRLWISGGQFKNRCSVFPRNALQRTVILDLSGWIWESLHALPWKQHRECSDSGFEWVNLGIAAGILWA